MPSVATSSSAVAAILPKSAGEPIEIDETGGVGGERVVAKACRAREGTAFSR